MATVFTRTQEFERKIFQEWSEHYYNFIVNNKDIDFIISNEAFTANKNITPETILKYPDFEWSDFGLMKNPNITWEFVKKYKNGQWLHKILNTYNLEFFFYFRTTPSFNADREKHEDLMELTKKLIPIETKNNNIHNDIHKGVLKELFEQQYMNFNSVEEFVDTYVNYLNTKKYRQSKLCLLNKFLKPEHINQYPSVNWDYFYYAAKNENMTVECLTEWYNKKRITDRQFEIITLNDKFTIDDILSNNHLPWYYISMYIKPTLSFETILKIPRNISSFITCRIADNTFDYEREKFLLERRRKYLAAYRIQQYWYLVTTDPTYKLCREKLERDYYYSIQNH